VLPAREKYSKIVGLWQTEAGQPNEVCHIWAYPSLNARAEARGNAMKDPAWQEFLAKARRSSRKCTRPSCCPRLTRRCSEASGSDGSGYTCFSLARLLRWRGLG